jgi:hypothetical protein
MLVRTWQLERIVGKKIWEIKDRIKKWKEKKGLV